MKITDKIYILFTEHTYKEYCNYEMTPEEIQELEDITYSQSSGIFPIGDFLNDIRDTKAYIKEYNANQAYKDFCLIMYHILKWQNEKG